jgi:hypothetical protein
MLSGMTWAPPVRTDGRVWCGERHAYPDARLAVVLYRSTVQEETPLCEEHAASWRAAAEALDGRDPHPEFSVSAVPLADHRRPAAVVGSR